MRDQATGTAASAQGGGQFAETHWSMVLRAAGQPDAPGAATALESLCRIYWYPVYAWVRSRGHGPEDAKDLTQQFLATLLRRGSLETVNRDKGRFRTFLIRSIQYFLTDQHRQDTAAKRGGGMPLLELDSLDPEQRYAFEPVTHDTPDAAFDRRWCNVLVTRAFQRLEAEQVAAGRGQQFAVLREFIGGAPDAGEYAQAAEKFGLTEN